MYQNFIISNLPTFIHMISDLLPSRRQGRANKYSLVQLVLYQKVTQGSDGIWGLG